MDSGDHTKEIMNASMNLMRRLPPKDIPKNLGALCEMILDDDLRDDVMLKTDQPIRKFRVSHSHFPQRWPLIQLKEKNTSCVSITKMETPTDHPGAISSTHPLTRAMTATSQPTPQLSCWRWSKNRMKCSQDMQSYTTTATF